MERGVVDARRDYLCVRERGRVRERVYVCMCMFVCCVLVLECANTCIQVSTQEADNGNPQGGW